MILGYSHCFALDIAEETAVAAVVFESAQEQLTL